MKGVVFETQGSQPKVVDTIEKPTPKDGQVLVRSLWTAINPVDGFMANTGVLVTSFPLTLGVDASGVIVETTPSAKSKHNLKVGDYIFGCSRCGEAAHGTAQEYFLMDALVTIPRPKNLSARDAATIGVGIKTAALGVYAGLGVVPPASEQINTSLKNQTADKEWIVIMGGASSVGKAAVQLARSSGHRVVATCSSRSVDLVVALGAETVDYKLPVNEMIQNILKITGGVVPTKVFDAMASNDPALAKELFKQSDSDEKRFSSTNDWSGIGDFEGGKTYEVKLGPIGKPEASELNNTLAGWITTFVKLLEHDLVRCSESVVIEGGSDAWDNAVKAYEYQGAGKGGNKKVVVKLQDE